MVSTRVRKMSTLLQPYTLYPLPPPPPPTSLSQSLPVSLPFTHMHLPTSHIPSVSDLIPGPVPEDYRLRCFLGKMPIPCYSQSTKPSTTVSMAPTAVNRKVFQGRQALSSGQQFRSCLKLVSHFTTSVTFTCIRTSYGSSLMLSVVWLDFVHVYF